MSTIVKLLQTPFPYFVDIINGRPRIDKPYYERAYPVTAVLYAIYPLNVKPNVHDLTPVNVSKLNCAAEQVIEQFTNGIHINGSKI